MLVVKRDTAKKCMSSKGKVKPGRGKAQSAQAATHPLEEAICKPYYATVRGKDIIFETDSGASASVISEETYRRTWGYNLPPIRLLKLQLRTYVEQPIPHLGVLYVYISAEGQKTEASLVIAKGRGPSLLGHNWLCKIWLNWHEIKYAHMVFTGAWHH